MVEAEYSLKQFLENIRWAVMQARGHAMASGRMKHDEIDADIDPWCAGPDPIVLVTLDKVLNRCWKEGEPLPHRREFTSVFSMLWMSDVIRMAYGLQVVRAMARKDKIHLPEELPDFIDLMKMHWTDTEN